MNIWIAILSGLGGSLAGALFNYYLARSMGRKVLLKYGKYVFIKEETLDKLEKFFTTHGHISTFTGRLIPGVRQLISIPAGLSQMDLKLFSLYTALGAGIWSLILIILGYLLGENEALIKEYLHQITLAAVGSAVLIMVVYYYFHRRKRV
jgi:membrane protein DedA with SNARE-associated domain